MSQATLAPPEVWRHLLRATLRECSYLPDPIAREYMHKYALDRYRKNSYLPLSDSKSFRQPRSRSEKRCEQPKPASLERQGTLRKSAKKFLSLLRRANEGYQPPLERVLMLAYGRIGVKKYTLLSSLLRDAQEEKVLNSSVDAQEALKKLSVVRYGDDWAPPELLTSLLKSQKNCLFAHNEYARRFKVQSVMKVPKLNSWKKPMPEVRRKNIKRRFFVRAKYGALPPVDSEELAVLRGLMDGTEPWRPPVRRKEISPPAAVSSRLETFLLDGPQKGPAFRSYYMGRPHRITRNFMHSVWERTYNLIPEQELSDEGKTRFIFPKEWRRQPLIVSVEDEHSLGIFDTVDENVTIKSGCL